MDWTLEVVVLPVRDVDHSTAIHRDHPGFNQDHHTQEWAHERRAVDSAGSGRSILIGNLPSQPRPSLRPPSA